MEIFRGIKIFIFDVDGVMINSEVIVFEDGNLIWKMSIRDGFVFKMVVRVGYRVVVIMGGKLEGVIKWLKVLGVVDVYSGY